MEAATAPSPAKKPTKKAPEAAGEVEVEVVTTQKEDEAELDVLFPELKPGGTIVLARDYIHLNNKLEPGVICKCRPTMLRQLMALGRVITGSTRPLNVYSIIQPLLMAKNGAEQQAAAIAGFANLAVTVPHSEEEVIELLRSYVQPVDDKFIAKEHSDEFWNYLNNPDPEDLATIVNQIYTNDAPRMQALGKSLMRLFPTPSEEVTQNPQPS